MATRFACGPWHVVLLLVAREGGRGRPLAGLMGHGTSNAIIALFPTIATEADTSQVRWWLHQTLLLVVGQLFLPMREWSVQNGYRA